MCIKCLSDAEIALIHHDKMKELMMTVNHLTEQCAADNECRDRVYRVYSNSQTLLKTV